MRKLGMPYLFITLFMLLAYQSVSAQDTRSLSVDINLDVGVVDRPLDLEMTVNNHSFVFIFPNTNSSAHYQSADHSSAAARRRNINHRCYQRHIARAG